MNLRACLRHLNRGRDALLMLWLLAALVATATAKVGASALVIVTDNGHTWTLDNGVVKAVINQRNGAMESLFYKGIDTMGHDQGPESGVWEQDPSATAAVGGLTDSLTIDPATNGGARAEVSIKGVTGGKIQLTPNAAGGGTYCDMEIRYALGRGDSGIYVYAIFTHPAGYRGGGVGSESRYLTRVNQTFNWISVDADRNMLECAPTDWGEGVVVHAKEQRILTKGPYKNSVEHKYSYAGVQYQTHAYGWSSTKDHVGIWFINPTIEYLSGGPTKLELDCHYGDNGNPDPIILDYWEGGHYDGGARCNLTTTDNWSRVIGPIFVYVNSLSHPKTPSQSDLDTFAATAGNPTIPSAWTANANALFQDALAQAKKESARWPYDWVNGIDYPHKCQRGTVTGRIVLQDPQAKTTRLPHLLVGLVHPDEVDHPVGWQGGGQGGGQGGALGGRARGGGGGPVEGIRNAKYYQFWADGSPNGTFTIPNIRPGTYTLHAFADGVLGEFVQTNIVVAAGQPLDLGKLAWSPVRYGRQLWEIGYPDRTGGKFFKGDGPNYWLWGWNLRYALLFPHDITYTIGQSDYHKDWFFEEVPHATNLDFINPAAPDPANQRFGWVRGESLDQYPQSNTHGPWNIYGRGRGTVWTIKFKVGQASSLSPASTSVRAVSIQDNLSPFAGQAALRVALAGVNAIRQLAVAVNGHSAGAIGGGDSPQNAPLRTTNTIRYNSDKGLWQERTLRFDAALLKPGDNEMTFTLPGGDLQSGVVWDYLRLELADSQ